MRVCKLKKNLILLFLLGLFSGILVGCGDSGSAASETSHGESALQIASGESGEQTGENALYVDEVKVEGADSLQEHQELAKEPAIPNILRPDPSGVLTQENEKAIIDYSNTTDGYVCVRYLEQTDKKLKVQVKGTTTTYTYTITPGEWETFPLSDGNGEYQVAVYENVEGKKYALAQSVVMDVQLGDEFAPFLRPNQYVDYGDATETIRMAALLTTDRNAELEKVKAIYEYVVNNISYDMELAQTVQSGYLPDLDSVLQSGKGICFDYAALMTGMLRSQSIPCKLVVGYAGEAYHAWISVYTEKDGWIDNAIYFDGTTWKRMDPTFASSGKNSKKMLEYIGDGTNYIEKYLY